MFLWRRKSIRGDINLVIFGKRGDINLVIFGKMSLSCQKKAGPWYTCVLCSEEGEDASAEKDASVCSLNRSLESA